jgi:enterobactin synthetase component D
MFSNLELNSGVTHSISLPLEQNIYQEYEYLLDDSLIGAIYGRKEEFVAARACALLGLNKLNANNKIVMRSSKRHPIWPQGFIGSISHTKDLALASIYKEGYCKSVGVDCEILIKPERFESIKDYITRAEDLRLLNNLDCNSKLSILQTLVFSAKESLYKAISPLYEEFFGFQEAYLDKINFEEGTFSIILKTKVDKLKPYEATYFGRFLCSDTHIITSIEIH